MGASMGVGGAALYHNIKNGSISDFANMLNRDYESNANDSDGDNQEV